MSTTILIFPAVLFPRFCSRRLTMATKLITRSRSRSRSRSASVSALSTCSGERNERPRGCDPDRIGDPETPRRHCPNSRGLKIPCIQRTCDPATYFRFFSSNPPAVRRHCPPGVCNGKKRKGRTKRDTIASTNDPLKPRDDDPMLDGNELGGKDALICKPERESLW